MAPGLVLEHIYTAYDRADVLSGVSLEVEPGKITCILGSNGAGKSTLIRSILSLTAPRSGRILYDGADITALPTHQIIRRGIACIPEGRKVFPKMTVRDNLLVGGYQESERQVLERRLKDVFRVFPQLRDRTGQLAGTMSGGEQAMLSIGRGMMAAPKLLIIDEPSLGLSPLYVKANFSVIRAINEQGVTVLLVEQNVKQTLTIAHRGYVLSQGRVVAAGDADQLRENPEVREAYFGRQ
jgi:branched-chain amino acid transport system ATP-binding protein